MGLAGAGLTGYKMKKRVGEIEEFAFDELSTGHELHVTIGVSGWLTDDKPGQLFALFLLATTYKTVSKHTLCDR